MRRLHPPSTSSPIAPRRLQLVGRGSNTNDASEEEGPLCIRITAPDQLSAEVRPYAQKIRMASLTHLMPCLVNALTYQAAEKMAGHLAQTVTDALKEILNPRPAAPPPQQGGGMQPLRPLPPVGPVPPPGAVPPGALRPLHGGGTPMMMQGGMGMHGGMYMGGGGAGMGMGGRMGRQPPHMMGGGMGMPPMQMQMQMQMQMPHPPHMPPQQPMYPHPRPPMPF